MGDRLIRPADPGDTDSIVALWLAASCEAHSFVPAEYWESKAPEMRDVYIPGSETYVAIDDDRVLGFISLAGDFVPALFVDPAAQGSGVGSKLLAHVQSIRDELSLAVYTQNERALGFYKHQGFAVIEERVNGDTGKPESVMSWSSATV